MPELIINQAKKNVGASHVRFERIITELEEEKRVFEKQKKELKKKDADLKNLVEEYESLRNYIDSQKDQMLREARQQADLLIRQANKEIEKTIREIKEKKAEKELTRNARKSLETFRSLLKDDQPPIEKQQKKLKIDSPVTGPIRENDYVKITDSGAFGIVSGIKGNQAELTIGDLKSKVKLSRLKKISRSEYQSSLGDKPFTDEKVRGIDLSQKIRDFSTTIDLRGKRAEEALTCLGNYLDDAQLLEAKEVRILHGKGDGILRTVIRNFLQQASFVRSARDAHVERGGAGVTVVTLK